MKTLTLPGVSFRRDSEALTSLLYRLFDIAKQKNGLLEMEDIAAVARELGFVGSSGSLCRLLINQGFLSGSTEEGYWFNEENEAALSRFRTHHKHDPLHSWLTPRETAYIFRKVAEKGGTPIGQASLRIFRLLGALKDELARFPSLSQVEREALAAEETARYFTERHLWWLTAQIKILIEEMKQLDHSEDPEAEKAIAVAYQEAEGYQSTLREESKKLLMHVKNIARIKHDEKLSVIMKSADRVVGKLIILLCKAEMPN